MLVVLGGVTGCGKSFFKNVIVQELGFENLSIVTTREKREGEINGIDKEFVTKEKFEIMKKSGITQINFEFLGAQYAYRKEHLRSQKNRITELHYPMIYEFKKWVKDLFCVYIVPYEIERARLELQKRNLPQKVFQKRLQEMDEHTKEYASNPLLRQQFDYVLVNRYDESSKRELIKQLKQEIKN